MANTYSGGAPMPGAHIYTADGDDLGTVKEVQGRYFKVDAGMQPDYWLSSECVVGSATGGDMRLSFSKDQLGNMKLKDPDDEHPTPHR
jgi:hypothetical protein